MPIIQQRDQGPSGAHLLGTDWLGRDELARLLYGVHSSMLLVGATFALAAVVAAVVLAVVRLLGRKRGQEWARWAGVILTPVVGVLLLGVASLVVPLLLPSGVEIHPDLFSYIFTVPQTFVLQNPFSTGLAMWYTNQYYYLTSTLVLVMLAGELVRFVYLVVRRLRSARAPQPRADMAPVTPAWVNIAVPAVAIGLWVAADALLLEGLLDSYVAGLEQPIPSLGLMFGQSGGVMNQQPWLVLAPLIAILVLYASLNVVGFELRGVREAEPARSPRATGDRPR